MSTNRLRELTQQRDQIQAQRIALDEFINNLNKKAEEARRREEKEIEQDRVVIQSVGANLRKAHNLVDKIESAIAVISSNLNTKEQEYKSAMEICTRFQNVSKDAQTYAKLEDRTSMILDAKKETIKSTLKLCADEINKLTLVNLDSTNADIETLSGMLKEYNEFLSKNKTALIRNDFEKTANEGATFLSTILISLKDKMLALSTKQEAFKTKRKSLNDLFDSNKQLTVALFKLLNQAKPKEQAPNLMPAPKNNGVEVQAEANPVRIAQAVK